MATFLQWNRNRPLRRITWVCGPEDVLVYEVLRHTREQLSALPYYPLYASREREPAIWDELLSAPPGGRLVVVHAAEKLRGHSMPALVEAASELCYTVFVSAADVFERGEDGLAPHLAALKSSRSGQLVRCCAPSSPEECVKLVASWWPGAGKNFAARVLSASGSLGAARQACEIAERAGLRPDEQGFRLACRVAPGEVYADLVVAGDRKAAMVAAGQLGTREVGGALGQLSHRLSVLGVLRTAADKGLEPGEIERKYKVDRYQQRLYGPHAASYSPRRADRCRELLVLAEDAWRSGVSGGVAEVVAALW